MKDEKIIGGRDGDVLHLLSGSFAVKWMANSFVAFYYSNSFSQR
jgi:hypothetical protein